ncbi:hypothetical protein [Synechococcus sp. RS9916]|uniref:hypothetical protein n=1 Tax=Synechococcus sp. RS9916 TaxID=221359 RepID=UPI0000E53437|nr:hypothetical protein [Synechococcus sp. RS9916]EAU74622.1 hypothetical protein RS9916_33982 [Synechococcus sp. RS9916]
MKNSIAYAAAGLSALIANPICAYEEMKPLNYYPLRYKCKGGHTVALAYNSLDEIPSAGWGYNGKMLINGKEFKVSYYFKGAQVIDSHGSSYPSFQGRGQAKGIATLSLSDKSSFTCWEVI